MRIILAGYNVEKEMLDKLPPAARESLSPETFSAAYARISRSAKTIERLREDARSDVDRARKSNQMIIFEMGHHSVAEHAVFNFDIIDVSRLALEEIEKFRLASYTEKSQRYVTLKGDYLIPGDITGKSDRSTFSDTIKKQNDFYQLAFSRLKENIFSRYKNTEHNLSRRDLENLAKEDARYILSLSTLGQVGMTVNARNLEHMFRKFALSSRMEVQQIGKELFRQVQDISPSLILFPEPSAFDSHINDSFGSHFQEMDVSRGETAGSKVVMCTDRGDDKILAAFLSIQRTVSFKNALSHIQNMTMEKKRDIFMDLFKHMEFFDTPPREFEVPDVMFQATISASCFAQLKRHRMATLISGPYDHRLKNTVPDSIRSAGLDKEFSRIIEYTNETYLHLKERYPDGADYILTNSHRRLILMKMNLRELYHFIRLRDDDHAQWDIRKLAGEIFSQVLKKMPLSSLMLCGKSQFKALYKKTFGKDPSFSI